MPQYIEDYIALAIKDIINGKSFKLAAKEQGIPHSILQDRIKGSETHYIAAESQ